MNRIKELRKQKGIKQKELAKSLGVTQQTISLYEKDNREPKLATWKKTSKFLSSIFTIHSRIRFRSSASQLGLIPSEVTSHEVTHCPFCGSSLADDEDKIDKQGD